MEFFQLLSPERELKYAIAIGSCVLGVVFIFTMLVIGDRKSKEPTMPDQPITAATWTTDWSEIDERASYFICPISKTGNRYWLGQPERLTGWQVKQRKQGCYVAMVAPECDVERLVKGNDHVVI